ncbi:MAG TPA: hypothetical protein VN622_03665 [Clostridia bacterium]|nr:hypothetical protein [Clostridia bacterium]
MNDDLISLTVVPANNGRVPQVHAVLFGVNLGQGTLSIRQG